MGRSDGWQDARRTGGILKLEYPAPCLRTGDKKKEG